MGKPDAGNLHVRFDEGEGHGPAGPSLLDRFIHLLEKEIQRYRVLDYIRGVGPCVSRHN